MPSQKEARLKAEQEAKLEAAAAAIRRLKKVTGARMRAEEEAKLKDRLKAEEVEARLKAEEVEARLKAEEEVRLKAEEEARLNAEVTAAMTQNTDTSHGDSEGDADRYV